MWNTTPEQPYRDLIYHPVRAIDPFLLAHAVDAAWIGIVGGPRVEDGDIVVTYNVRTVDGPYEGQICADFDYRFEPGSKLDVEEISPTQVAAIEKAFPAADVQCYVPDAWEDYRE